MLLTYQYVITKLYEFCFQILEDSQDINQSLELFKTVSTVSFEI